MIALNCLERFDGLAGGSKNKSVVTHGIIVAFYRRKIHLRTPRVDERVEYSVIIVRHQRSFSLHVLGISDFEIVGQTCATGNVHTQMVMGFQNTPYC